MMPGESYRGRLNAPGSIITFTHICRGFAMSTNCKTHYCRFAVKVAYNS